MREAAQLLLAMSWLADLSAWPPMRSTGAGLDHSPNPVEAELCPGETQAHGAIKVGAGVEKPSGRLNDAGPEATALRGLCAIFQ